MEENGVFRKESMERIASPEQLNDYLKVTGPKVWLLLLAVISLLAGALVWSMAGNLETLEKGEAVVESGRAVMLAGGNRQASEFRDGMVFRVGGKEGVVENAGYLPDGQVTVSGSFDLPDGWYPAEIVLESVHPISFLLH